MSKNLLAFCTFGGLKFTKLLVQGIRETVKNSYDIAAIVGKPGDWETAQWFDKENIPYVMHKENMGFPFSVNDLYDYAWKVNNYDNLVLMGNDVVPYPYCIDSLIDLASASDYEVISALQYDIKDLIREFPDAASCFSGNNYVTKDLSSEPWKRFANYSPEHNIADMRLYDIQNLCLYKRSVFQKVGYTDVNFYPAYFIDNDYARRIVLSNIKCCSLTNARFFHFWSRTIHEGSGGSTSKQFERNKDYYKMKWGGEVGKESATPNLSIFTRASEVETVRMWRSKQ
jgi:GT2 family glycosyltransferase